MRAEALGVLEEAGRVVGLTYRDQDGSVRQVRAQLTVAADGRDSGLRRSAGLRPRAFGAPVDVLWFRLSRRPDDPTQSFGRLAAGHLLVLLDRGGYWQIAYVIPKDSADKLHEVGLARFRAWVAELVPFLADRVGELGSWDDVRVLRAQVDRLRRWFRPGLLCIGDAAHAMPPIGGVGINLAVHDAVATANLLTRALGGRNPVKQAPGAGPASPHAAHRAHPGGTARHPGPLPLPLLAGRLPARPPLVMRALRRYRSCRRSPPASSGSVCSPSTYAPLPPAGCSRSTASTSPARPSSAARSHRPDRLDRTPWTSCW